MKQIFNDITAVLDAIPELRWVDEDKGQMNFERPPIAFPAALVTISLPQIQNLSTKTQEANLQLVVKLCFDYSGETASSTPIAAREKSLAHYDIVEAVKDALQGLEGSVFNPLEQRNFGQLPRPDQYKTVQMVFTSGFIMQ